MFDSFDFENYKQIHTLRYSNKSLIYGGIVILSSTSSKDPNSKF